MREAVTYSFFDELEKISELTYKERERKKHIALTALGALSGPVIGAVGNTISHGRISPKGVRLSRWLPATMATGALVSGAVPILRRKIERHYDKK